jgi:glutathione-specific gamma-glutamylcyclotransferase
MEVGDSVPSLTAAQPLTKMLTADHEAPVEVLTLDAIKNGFLQRLIASSSASRVWTEGELHASLRGTLAGHHGQDVWLFAYGSLIWNPAFVYVEKCIARVHGFHRRFSLRTKIGRGSPSHPGYVLGLDRGGSCRGVVFRIAEQNVASELEVVWRREMVTGAYVPTWVRAHLAGRTMKALTFVTNRRHPAYVGRFCEDAIARSIATAVGPLGHCRDYLMRTHHGLSDVGIRDRYVSRIGERVEYWRATLSS